MTRARPHKLLSKAAWAARPQVVYTCFGVKTVSDTNFRFLQCLLRAKYSLNNFSLAMMHIFNITKCFILETYNFTFCFYASRA